MRTRTLASACAALVLAWSAASSAEPQLASPADGKAMLERAIAALKANEAAALKAFNDEKNKDFRDRDLYVYCFSLPGREYHRLPKPGHDRHQCQGAEGSRRTIPSANAPMMRLQRPPKARLSALPTISPSPAPKRPRPRKRSKPASASRPAASVISSRKGSLISGGDALLVFSPLVGGGAARSFCAKR